MTDGQTAEEHLWRHAIEHVLAVRAAPGDPGAHRAANDWRARSPAHQAAFAEAERVWRVAGTLPPAYAHRWNRRPGAFGQIPRQGSTRSLRFWGVLALVAAVVVAVVVALPVVIHRVRGGEMTGTAQVRTMRLPDGSRVTLGPRSALRVAFDGTVRRVDLLDGMAFFEVGPGDHRPFIVRNGSLTARALGTAFEVERNGDRLSVSVERGAVAISSVDGPPVVSERLRAGDLLTVDRGTGTAARGRVPRDQIAIWRDRMLVVERRSIHEVATEIARWHPGVVAVVDSRLGARLVSGIFDLRDPVGALNAVVEPHGGRVRRLTRWVVLLDGA